MANPETVAGQSSPSRVSPRPRRARLVLAAILATPLAALAVGALGAFLALDSSPASAAPTAVCTWNGSGGAPGNWSVGTNWTTTSGASCTAAGGPPAGAQIVFPVGATTATVTYDAGTEAGGGGAAPATSFDSIDFEDPYTVNEGSGAATSITLTPTAATTDCGSATTIAICQAGTSGTVAFHPGITIGTSGEEVASKNAASLELEGVIAGSAMNLTVGDAANAGTVVLYPLSAGNCTANTYSGTTAVGGGELDPSCPDAISGGTGTVTVASVASLLPSLQATGTIANPIIDNSTSSPGGVVVCASSGVTTTLTGQITGTGSLTTGYPGCPGDTVVLDNATGDTYTGGTTVSASGSTLVTEGAVSDELATTGALTVNTAATYDMHGLSQAVASLSGAGTVENQLASSAVTLEDAGGTTTFSGTIQDNSGSGGTVAVKVDAAAALTLSGTNTYTGGTTVSSGTLEITNGSALGTGGTTVVGGVLDSANGITVPAANGALTLDGGTLEATGASDVTWDGAVTLTASSTIDQKGASIFIVGGAVTDGGSGYSLEIGASSFTGNVDLLPPACAANTYGGGTTVFYGTALYLGCGGSAGTGTITVGTDAMVSVPAQGTVANDIDLTTVTSELYVGTASGSIAFSGNVTGPGYLNTYTDATSVTLSGANSFSGGATLATAGSTTFDSGAANAYGSGQLDVAAGATLDLAGHAQQVSAVRSDTGTITDSGAAANFTITGTGGSNFTVSENLTGSLGLVMGPFTSSTTAGLPHANSYSGGTSVDANGHVVAFAAGALGSATSVSVGANGDLAWELPSSATVPYSITDDSVVISEPATGTTTTFSGTISGTGNFTAETTVSGPAGFATTKVTDSVTPAGGIAVEGSGSPAGPTGVLDVAAGATAGTVTLSHGFPDAVLEGTGSIGGLDAGVTGEAVVPGSTTPAPGILHDSGNATFAAGGGLHADITGFAPGSGYSQLSGSATASLGGTLAVTDSFAGAPYGTTFDILTAAGGVSGTFAGLANGAVLVAGGRRLEVYYTATAVELVDVTNPPLTPPTVTGVSPASGPPAGGTAVTITGTNFQNPAIVDFGSVEATGATVVSPTEITAVSPAQVAGAVDVTVATPGGTSATSASDRFTYAAPPPPGLSYVGVTPARICDTRSAAAAGGADVVAGVSGPCANGGQALAGGGTEMVQVTGVGPVPTNGIGAVVLNVTAIGPAQPGYLTVSPAGTARPVASDLNFSAGQLVAGLVEVPVSAAGQVAVFNGSPGATDLAIDVEGYATTGSGSRFTGTSPSRICDTRPGNPSSLTATAAQCNGKTLVPGSPLEIQVAGVGSVPASATAVIVNLTVVGPVADGYLTAYPGPSPSPGPVAIPVVSNLNFRAGETVANRSVIALSASGTIDVVASASTDVVVDVSGYFSSTGAGYTALLPTRIADTRCGISPAPAFCASEGLPAANAALTTLGPGGSETIQVAGVGEVPGSATSVVLEVTATDTTAGSYLTAWPEGQPLPTASDLNWSPGRSVANLVVVGVGPTGAITVFNHSGSVDVVVDVEGYEG